MGEVVAFTHCHGGIGEVLILLTSSIRPLPSTEDGVILWTGIKYSQSNGISILNSM